MLRVLLCLLCAAAAMAAGAEPVAMIVHLPAEARITHGSTTTKGRLLQKLEPNDRVQAVGGDVGIVLIEGGKRFLLAAGQSGIVSAVGIAGARQIAALRAPGLEARTKIGNERGGVNFARPLGDATELVDFPGYYLSGNRKFKWDSGFFQTAKPASYRFSLYDRIGNLLWSTHTTELEAQWSTRMGEDAESWEMVQPAARDAWERVRKGVPVPKRGFRREPGDTDRGNRD